MSDARYFDRDGKQIDQDEWWRLQNTPAYKKVRGYDNGKFYCHVWWHGTSRQPFIVVYGQNQHMDCLDLQTAINQYEALVVENTDSEWIKGEDGWHLMEIGNIYLPKGQVLQQEAIDSAQLREGIEANAEYATW